VNTSPNGKSLPSSTALVRTSINPDCELIAAIALERKGEKEIYKAITGHEYEGEYGIRQSLQRRGNKFERNNHLNDAAALRKLIAELFDFPKGADGKGDPEAVLVRDLDDQIPTNMGRINDGNLRRWRVTRDIIRDTYAQKPNMPHLIIHPTLELPILRDAAGNTVKRGAVYVNPDFMVRAPGTQIYLPGDEKSFIVRDEAVVDPDKLDMTRRQIAASTLAMQYALTTLSPQAKASTEGILIFASPFGLRASVAKREDLSAEIAQVERAIPLLINTGHRLAKLRATGNHQLATMATQFNTSLRESCIGKCIMADYCEKLEENRAVALGKDVYRLTGGLDLSEIVELVGHRQNLSRKESELLRNVEQASHVLGLTLDQFAAEIA
jgi:hypothetical protein